MSLNLRCVPCFVIKIHQRHYDGIKLYVDSEVKQLVNDTLEFARYGDWASVSDGATTGVSFTRTDISTHAFLKVGIEKRFFAGLLSHSTTFRSRIVLLLLGCRRAH
jgi:hypothetical protein